MKKFILFLVLLPSYAVSAPCPVACAWKGPMAINIGRFKPIRELRAASVEASRSFQFPFASTVKAPVSMTVGSKFGRATPIHKLRAGSTEAKKAFWIPEVEKALQLTLEARDLSFRDHSYAADECLHNCSVEDHVLSKGGYEHIKLHSILQDLIAMMDGSEYSANGIYEGRMEYTHHWAEQIPTKGHDLAGPIHLIYLALVAEAQVADEEIWNSSQIESLHKVRSEAVKEAHAIADAALARVATLREQAANKNSHVMRLSAEAKDAVAEADAADAKVYSAIDPSSARKAADEALLHLCQMRKKVADKDSGVILASAVAEAAIAAVDASEYCGSMVFDPESHGFLAKNMHCALHTAQCVAYAARVACLAHEAFNPR